MLRRSNWLIVIGLMVVLAACGSSNEEASYFNGVFEDVTAKNREAGAALEDYKKAIIDTEPQKAIEILNEKVIPAHEYMIDHLKMIDLSEEKLSTFNELTKEVAELDMEKYVLLRDIFKEIMEANKTDRLEQFDFDSQMESLYNVNEKQLEKIQLHSKKTEELAKDSDYLNVEDLEAPSADGIDVPDMNEADDKIVSAFIESVTNSTSAVETSEEDSEKDSQENSENQSIDKALLSDQGNPEVVFDGNVKIDETFHLKGKSNLPDGATLQIKTYLYGSENPYLKDDIQVDQDGNFEYEVEIADEEDFTGEPMMVRVGYMPDTLENESAKGLYGEEGEKLKGAFAHKYTDIKRTRRGAFAYAYLTLDKDQEAPLEGNDWDKPDDYGDMNIWMEKEEVKINEEYYDVKMNSNLNELTYIRAEVEVPGYELAGYTSRIKVLADGSFRFQIPRPDVESDDVIIVIEATTDMALETEELYGVHGENFEGDLVEKTKQGKKVKYQLHLGEEN